MSPSSRNPYISNCLSVGNQRIGSEIKDADNNLKIKNLYRAERQLAGLNLYILKHEGIVFETTDKKYGIIEYMGDSMVYEYFLETPKIYDKDNKLNDGKYIWTLKKVQAAFKNLKQLREKAYQIKDKFKKYSIRKNNCQSFVKQMFDKVYEKLTWDKILLAVGIAVLSYGVIMVFGSATVGCVGYGVYQVFKDTELWENVLNIFK